jgi:hypothetical protein
MAPAPAIVERIVWVTLPAALYFALRGLELMNDGVAWSAAAHAMMAVVIATTPFLAKGRVVGGRRAVSYLVVTMVGAVGWLAGPTAVVQSVGFCLTVLGQVAVIATARQVGVEAPPLRDDSAVELGINRRAG